MKILLLILLPILSFSQEKFGYVEIIGVNKMMSTKITVTLNFGQRLPAFADTRFKDETGKPVVFNSMIDAANYLGAKGWEFQQSFYITNGSGMAYYYILKKPYSAMDEEERKIFAQ